MSSNRDKIQALIAEIDGVMPKMTSRIAWWMSGDARRVLERVRTYLVSLQHEDLRTSSTSAPKTNSEVLSSPKQPAAAPGELDSAQSLWRGAIEQEISLLRTGLMQPLLSEIAALRQERETLAQEIRQLEINRHHQYSLAQQQTAQQQLLADWLQGLMSRLQESLKEQVARSLMQLESNLLTYEAGSSPKQLTAPNQVGALSREKVPPESAHPLLDPQTRLEHLRMLQSESDGLLISLDTTLRAVFESIERNLHAYEQSMSESVEKIYRLGQQGEVIFAQLVGQMSQPDLRRSAPLLDTDRITPISSAPLPPSPSEAVSEEVSSAEALLFSSPPPLSAPTAEPSALEFPFAGSELVEPSDSEPPTANFFGDGLGEIVASGLPEVAPGDTDQLLKADAMVESALVDEESAVDEATGSELVGTSAGTDVDDRLVVTAATAPLPLVSVPPPPRSTEEIDEHVYESLLLAAGASPPVVSVSPSVDQPQDVFGEMTTPSAAAPSASDVAVEEEYLLGGIAAPEPGEGWDWDFAPPRENVMASAPVVKEPQPRAASQGVSLEAFLFGDGDDEKTSPTPANTTDALNLDSPLPQPEPNVAAAEPLEQGISGLGDFPVSESPTVSPSDLFGDLGAGETDSEVNQLAESEDAAYMAALPDEDLLADGSADAWGVREPNGGSDPQLWLNTNALKQLSEDLSSLEISFGGEAVVAKDNSEAMLDDMLDQWTAEPPDVVNVPVDAAASKDDMFDWPDNSGAARGASVSDLEIGTENENLSLVSDEIEVEAAPPTTPPPTVIPSGVAAEPKPEVVTVDDIFADLMAASSTPSPSAPPSQGNEMADLMPESQSFDSGLDDFFDGFVSSGQMSTSLPGERSMSDLLPQPEAPEASDLSDSTLDDFFASLSEDKPNR
ncbi:MAG TPA: hypothetical protein IGS52_02285 [Oscillatoriaceae cyanobacterium M33_DOE_052]|uniref:Uncharacterized protein n=1 Tax=Planktothricoides sp. SpSt-374 TaxID=2282167 RepID=A0A7C3ZMZ9_9CYAN|nr:hypothetical protein [Oscillatoriaceae cyanobacterium M33_DOE_052]